MAEERGLRRQGERALGLFNQEKDMLVPGAVDFIVHALVVPSPVPAALDCLDSSV